MNFLVNLTNFKDIFLTERFWTTSSETRTLKPKIHQVAPETAEVDP